ncbi:hypothetical protein NPX13_g8275 [Xylaria arbuscula]|uniref:Uncharacterized protein n=1 Tax=Xylaria arbuscula TaxID=114810 RepID=A0A9W8N8G6_9PEZI|nr:hypothetical protein NPX13_g8275 [Xylaria arbuscula]
MASIGPSLPPHLAKRKRTPDDDNETSADSPPTKIRASESARTNEDEVDLDSDSDDGYGPSAPKPVARPSSIGPAPPPSKSIGPSLPTKVDGNSLHKDEEVIGPSAPLPPATSTAKRSIGPSTARTQAFPRPCATTSKPFRKATRRLRLRLR